MPLSEENKNITSNEDTPTTLDVCGNVTTEEMEMDVTVVASKENLENVPVPADDNVLLINNEDRKDVEFTTSQGATGDEKNLSSIQEQSENDESGTLEDEEKHEEEEDADDDGEQQMGNEENSMGSFEQVEEQDIEDFLDAQEDNLEYSAEIHDDTLLQDNDGVIAFNMSLEKRLHELSDAFDHFGQGGLSLQNFWALYVECYVEPTGWLALYKPKQENTPDLQCSRTSNHEYETVEVLQVNFSTLDVRVKRIHSKDEETKKEEMEEHGKGDSMDKEMADEEKSAEEWHEVDEENKDSDVFQVPLLDLYPLAKQEHCILNMKLTAKCLDNYRFFENHLFLPWDPEDAESWYVKNLESRIQLYYDLESGIISETMSKEIYGLIQEAKENQKKISKLEDQLDFHDSDTDIDENIVMEVFPLHTRQEEIQIRLRQLQNPFFRNMISTIRLAKKRQSLRTQEKILLIAQNFTCSELVSNLEFIKSQAIDANEKIRMIHTLQEALEICEPGVKIYVTAGVHPISGLGNLEEGGQIIGIPSTDKEEGRIVIETRDAADVFLSVSTDQFVSLENVHIRIGSKYTSPHRDNNDSSYLEQQPASYLAFLVARGGLNLKNVVLEGFTELGVGCDEIETNGLKVLSEGSCLMENCNIRQFNKGIVVREESQVNMESCIIENCLVGIEASSDAKMLLNEAIIRKCLKFGIMIKYKEENVETTTGGVEMLQTLPKFQVEANTTISDCVGGNVIFCNESNLSMRISE